MERDLYAKFAAGVYKEQPPSEIAGYTLVHSTPQVAVYRNGNQQMVFAVRGTQNFADARTDVAIFFNRLKRTKMYRRVNKLFKEIRAQYPQDQITAVGHSLGGSTVAQLLKDNLYNINQVYGFNIGMSPKSLMGHFEVCFKAKCKREKRLYRQKLNLFTTGADIISGLSVLAGAQVVRPQGFETHGIANFTTQVSEIEPIRGGRLAPPGHINSHQLSRIGLNPFEIRQLTIRPQIQTYHATQYRR